MVQTFGDRISFRPHLHLLVTEGGVDQAGTFHLIPRLDEAKVLVGAWRRVYNRIRPHSSLGYRPPAPEAHVVGKFTLGLVQC